MKLKRKSLALMVCVACSGLLYGVNASAVTGFSSDSIAKDTIKGEMSKSSNTLPKMLEKSSMAASTENIFSPLNASRDIANFDAFSSDVKTKNDINTQWVTEVELILDADGAGIAGAVDGLFKALQTTADGNDFHILTKNTDGSFKAPNAESKATDKNEVSETLLGLIQLAQEAANKDNPTGGIVADITKGTHFKQFIKDYGLILKDLSVVDGTSANDYAIKDSSKGTPTDTFVKLVNLTKVKTADGVEHTISVKDIIENRNFLQDSAKFLNKGIPTAQQVSNQVLDGQSGGQTTILSEDSLTTGSKLNANLTDGDGGRIIASKGTILKIKGNQILDENGVLVKSQAAGFANGKLQNLGKVAIDNSNIQGSGNIVVAESTLTKDKKGNVYNLAKNITAYGNHNTIESNGIAVGNNNTVGEHGSVIGNNSEASKKDAIAIGNRAHATHANSIALGADSQTTKDNEVNVGGRTIGGVADGTQANDAVNRYQLDKVKSDSEDDATAKAGKALSDSKLYTNEKIETAGTAANTYTDKQVSGLKQEMNGKIDALDKKVNKGFAANAALSGLFQPYGVGKINMTAGVGGYQSESAVAVGVGYRVNENVALKAGIATAVGNGSSTMYNASVNFEW